MHEQKAMALFSKLEEIKALGRDPEDPEGPPIETRYAFAVRLTAGSTDEGRSRKWTVRVTALHEAADWRKVFAAIEKVDGTTYAQGKVWPRTDIRVDNAGVELS